MVIFFQYNFLTLYNFITLNSTMPGKNRPLINKKLKSMSELTEHTLANEIEAPHEILRK